MRKKVCRLRLNEKSAGNRETIPSNSKSGTGHDPFGHEERENRCGVADPKRLGLSIHLTSILQANTILWHNAIHVKERKFL